MLKICRGIGQLDFRQLMDVYEEGNMKNGEEIFGDAPRNQIILLAEQAETLHSLTRN